MKINYSYEEAADALGIGKDVLQDNIAQFPHRRYGRRVLFSEADLHVINEIHAVLPGQKQRTDRPEQSTKPATRRAPKPAKAANPLLDLKPRGARKQSA